MLCNDKEVNTPQRQLSSTWMHQTTCQNMWRKNWEPQGEIDESFIIVGDSNTLRSEIDRSYRQKISEDIIKLNSTISQRYIIDTYRLLHSIIADYTFLSSSHGTFTTTDHILGRKTHLYKSKRIETICSMLIDYNGIKLEISTTKVAGKSPNTWILNNKYLNNIWVKEVSREI